jgi:hypothetical protein
MTSVRHPRLASSLDLATVNALNATLTATSSNSKASEVATIESSVLVGCLHTALSLYQSDSILTVGQTAVFPSAQI